MRGWASLGELAVMPRRQALDMVDLLDAIEEAEWANRPKDKPKGG